MPPERPILLMVTSQDWGGAQAYIFNLAQELKARNLPVIVCAGGRGELGNRCREAGIEFQELKWMARDINPINNLLSLLELTKLFRRLRPQAIHLNSSMMGVVGSLAAKLTKVPRVVYVAHGWVFNEQLPAWKKKFYIWIEKTSSSWKDIIICLFPDDEKLARELKIKAREKIVTIPNGIDVGKFEQQLLDRDSARTTLNGRDSRFEIRDSMIVGTIANAYPPKNLIWYLDVCRSVHEQKLDVKFVIIGDGPQMDELRRKHKELKQEDYVLLAGRRMDAPQLYRAFDLFVLPSTKEGMSMTLLEAMASHVSIIATDVGANRWMLDSAGIIVQPNDMQALTNAILELMSDGLKHQTLANGAYEQIKNRFAWSKTVDETVKSLLLQK
ncbi:MAG: glycosyltransferase [Patescibacteria group bacterium]|nr:glycosyltransferase [Patescibacteria group bacterium]